MVYGRLFYKYKLKFLKLIQRHNHLFSKKYLNNSSNWAIFLQINDVIALLQVYTSESEPRCTDNSFLAKFWRGQRVRQHHLK
jgi:hypothetical protein